uniref:2-hydroxyacyl-CoA dehydratase n=1 Tax=candidate division WOR-3 bacterium TaxID=2052148 RepID=A0A7C4GIQ9_UNCW3
MALISGADREQLRKERLQELTRLKAEGTRVVGYFCLYAPVELIAAAGAVPVRLVRSSADAETAGERFLRADACSFCKSCLGGFEREPLFRLADGVVGVTTCDMMRRLPEAFEAHRTVPAFQLNLPRTSESAPHRLAEFRRQMAMLGDWLASLTGRHADEDGLQQALQRQNRLRQIVRRVDELRATLPAAVSGSDVLDVVALAGLLDPAAAVAVIERGLVRAGQSQSTAERPRVMLGGSIITEDDRWLVEMVEEKADIVADIVCTGARWAAEDAPVGEPGLDLLAGFYFSRLPCMCRRPNDRLYEHARQLVVARRVAGVVYKTLLYCDPWSFEARRLHDELGVPVLAIDSDYSGQNREQVRTRVEAFLETLAE